VQQTLSIKNTTLLQSMFFFEPPKGEEAHRTSSRRAYMRKTWIWVSTWFWR